MYDLDSYEDAGPDIGWCPRCAKRMDNEPPSYVVCTDCQVRDGDL